MEDTTIQEGFGRDSDASFNEDEFEGVEGSLGSMWHRWKRGSLRFLCDFVDTGGKASARTVVVVMFIEFLQLLSLAFPRHLDTSWNQINALEVILEPFGISFHMEAFDKGEHGLFFTFASLFIFGLVLNVLAINHYVGSKTLKPWQMTALHAYNGALTTVLVVPTLACFVGEGRAVLDEKSDVTGTAGVHVIAILCFLLAAAYILFTLALVAVNFTPQGTKVVLRQEHTRLDSMFHLFRAVAVILAVCVDNMFAMSLFLSLIGAAVLHQWLMYPPYITWGYNQLRVASFTVWTWAAISLFLQEATLSNATLMFFAGAPIAVVAALFFLLQRRQHLQQLPLRRIKSPLELVLKVRFYLAQDADANDKDTESVDETKSNVSLEDRSTVNQWWEAVAKRASFARSAFFQALWGLHHFSFDENHQLGLKKFAEAEELEPQLDVTFLIHRMRRVGEKLLSVGSDDVRTYLRYKHHLNLARRYDQEASALVVQFWAALLVTNPDINELHRIGAQTNDKVFVALKHYRNMLALNKCPQDMRAFGGFLMDLRHDMEEANALLIKADEVEEARSKQHDQGSNHINIFDDRNGIVMTSVVEGAVDEIVSFNRGASRIFGYSPSEVIGRTLGALMPPPFNARHSGYVQRYVETGQSRLVKGQVMFGLHKSGHIVPIVLRVHQVATKRHETSFLGVVKALDSQGGDYMLVGANGRLLHWTSGLLRYFPSNQLKRDVSISTLIPDFKTRQEQLEKDGGYSTIHTVGEEDYNLAIGLHTIRASNTPEIMVLKLNWTKLSAEELLELNDETGGATRHIFGNWEEEGNQQEEEKDGEVKKRTSNPLRRRRRPSNSAYSPDGSVHGSATSHRSGRSHRSNATAQATIANIRRMLLSKKAKASGGLQQLRRVFTLTVFIVAAACVASYIVTFVQLDRYETEMELVRKGATRLAHAGSAAQLTRQIEFSTNPYGINDQVEAILRELLIHAHTEMFDLERELYFEGEMSEKHRALYEVPSIMINELQAENFVLSSKRNLHDAVNQFASHIRALDGKNATEFVLTMSPGFFIHNNTFGSFGALAMHQRAPLIMAMNESARLYFEDSIAFAEDIKVFELVFMLLSLTMLTAVLVFVFRPVIKHVHNNKSRVMQLFLQLPKTTLQELHKKAIARVERLDAMLKEEGATTSKLNVGVETFIRTDVVMDQSAEKQMLETNNTNSAEKKKTIRNIVTRLTVGDSEQRVLYFKISLMLLLSAPYFIGVFFWTSGVVDDSVHSCREVLWAGQRMYLWKESSFIANELVAYSAPIPGLPAFILPTLRSHLGAIAGFLRSIHQALLYGDAYYELAGSLQSSAKQRRLFFEDGCMSYGQYTHPPTCGLDGASGELAKGAAPGVERYIGILEHLVSGASPLDLGPRDLFFLGYNTFTYLYQDMLISETMYRDDAVDHLSTFMSARLYLLLAIVFTLGLLFVLVYIPLISKLHSRNRRTRAMLLILPSKVVQESKSIKEFLAEHVGHL